MSPQFNPLFADYGDTVFYAPRIINTSPLKRGKIYLFNDPTKRFKPIIIITIEHNILVKKHYYRMKVNIW